MESRLPPAYAYVADGRSDSVFRMIDVSDPVRPVQAGFYDVPGVAASASLADGHIYVADWMGGLFVLRFTPGGGRGGLR